MKRVLLILVLLMVPTAAIAEQALPRLNGWGAFGIAVEKRLSLLAADISQLNDRNAVDREEISDARLRLYYAEGHIRVLEEQVKKLQEQPNN